MKWVLYAPVFPDFFIEIGWAFNHIAQIKATLFLLFGTSFSQGVYHDDGLDVLPSQRFSQQLGTFTNIAGTGFYTSLTKFYLFITN
ncbi:hypothetical protein [Tunicatimonas pelagia]|uniref:hypothetical protein n=1 Tax=Tunicatimonas pelagia TaxID=931531 RepID=UPI002665FC9B|nr:hypothetical protein [Tunicatimonas pelagia]WKN42232.1 hypothetical protein P0M28_24650 [Tunicatimonas pelagia]